MLAVSSATVNGLDIANQHAAQGVFAIAKIIAEAAMNVQFNRTAALSLATRVRDFVDTLADHGEFDFAKNPEVAKGLDDFRRVLSDIQTWLLKQKDRHYVLQLLSQERDKAQLHDYSDRLTTACQIVTMAILLQSSKILSSVVPGEIAVAALDSHAQIVGKLQPVPVAVAAPLGTPVLLPSPSRLFGRDAETQRMVDIILREDSAYIAVLGSPGIGKSSLAVAVLHRPEVVLRYGLNRYFIPFDAAEGRPSCLHLVAAACGISGSGNAILQKRLAIALELTPSLLVLDNFESAWDALETRLDAEDVLHFLSALRNVSVIVTQRGSERPHGISWSQPLLPPLLPLAAEAALQAFSAITDSGSDEAVVKELLAAIDHVPLAVVLMANIAQTESPRTLMHRWSDQATGLLSRSDGSHRLNSIECSIQISLASARLHPTTGAISLLYLLSLLPQGAAESDIALWACDLPRCTHALSALLQCGLAYKPRDHHVRVLAPIREFVLRRHPPPENSVQRLYTHHFELADLVLNEGQATSLPHVVAAVSREVENIEAVVRHALSKLEYCRPAVRAALCLCRLSYDTGVGSPSLLSQGLQVARSAHFDDLCADLLYIWGNLAVATTVAGDPAALFRDALSLYESAGIATGQIDTTLRLTTFLPRAEALAACERMYKLALEQKEMRRAARCIQQIANTQERAGQYDAACDSYSKAVAALRSLGHSEHRLIGMSLYRLGELSIDSGRITSGILELHNALDVLMAARYPLGLGAVHSVLGASFLSQGRSQSAIEHLLLAQTHFRTIGNSRREISCLLNLARAKWSAGDIDGGRECLEASEQLLRSLTDDWLHERGRVMLCRGELALIMGDYAESRVALEFAVTLCRSRDKLVPPEQMLQLQAQVYGMIGRLELVENYPWIARADLILAVVIHHKQGWRTAVVRELSRLAETLDDTTAEAILQATIPALYRFHFQSALADARSHLNRIYMRSGNTHLQGHSEIV